MMRRSMVTPTRTLMCALAAFLILPWLVGAQREAWAGEVGGISRVYVDASAKGGGDGLSWDGAFASLSEALDLVATQGLPGTEIFVAQGTYVPDGGNFRGFDFGATFTMPENARLIGGFSGDGTETDASEADPIANPTILSGDVLGDDGPGFANRSDNRYHVVTVPSGSSGIIEGVTIRGGNASGVGLDANGGGVFSVGGVAQFVNCVIEDNQASENGGGVYATTPSRADRGGTQFAMVNCELRNNAAGNDGGAVQAIAISMSISSSSLEDNQASGSGGAVDVDSGFLSIFASEINRNASGAFGGGVLCDNAEIFVIQGLFLENSADYGGGLALSGFGRTDIQMSDFEANQADFDGGAVWHNKGSSIVEFIDTSFVGNTSQSSGGGIQITGDDPFDKGQRLSGGSTLVYQCVFAGNQSSTNGAAINKTALEFEPLEVAQSSFGGHSGSSDVIRSDGNLSVVNTSMWDNAPLTDIRAFGFNNQISFSVFQSLEFPGELRGVNSQFNNVQQDPRFADVSGADLSLMPGSPAIDAGDSFGVGLPLDFLGNDRIVDDTGTPDTGVPEDGKFGPVVDIGAYEFQGTTMFDIDTFPFAQIPTGIGSDTFQAPLTLADIDGDSDLDVIAAINDGKGIAVNWYENSRGDLMNATARSFAFLSPQIVQQLDAGDVNGNGRSDVLIVGSDRLQIANNLGGSPTSFFNFVIADGFAQALQGGRLGDLDNDGDLDVLASLSSGLRWYENTSGDGMAPFQENQIDTEGDFGRADLGDLDGDGHLDIAVLADGELRAYFNAGNASAFSPMVIDPDANTFDASPVIADIDGDGAMDIVYAKLGSDGRGASLRVAVAFNEGLMGYEIVEIGPGVGIVTSIAAADIDNDGDLDIAWTDVNDQRIGWIENLGARSFALRTAYTDPDGPIERIAFGDMTLDGDSDLVALSPSPGFGSTPLLLVENELIHSEEAFTEGGVLAREANAITSVERVDLDGDGDLDLISGSFFDNRVLWYENPGTPDGVWLVHEPMNQSTNGVTSVHAIDFDNDGDMDILATSILDGEVHLYRNDINTSAGDETAFTAITLSTGLGGANDVTAGDFNDDGIPDALAVGATDNTIRVIFGQAGVTRGVGLSSVDITNTAAGVRAAFPSDIDNDGDLDVFAVLNGAGAVNWYENTGSGDGTAWEVRSIDPDAGDPIDIVAADFDRDGDIDAAVADAGGSLVWYENLGQGETWMKHTIADDLNGAAAVTVCDLNADGFPDLAVASRIDNSIRAFINSRAIGPFDFTSFTETSGGPVSTTAMGVQAVGAGDLDGDGRCDLFAGTFAGDAMIFFRNDGGQFETQAAPRTSEAVAGETTEIFEFTIDHRGLDTDVDARFTELNVLILDDAGEPMSSPIAETIFQRFDVIETGIPVRGVTGLVGELDDPSSISGGVITIPVSPMSGRVDIAPDDSRTYILRAGVKDGADLAFPDGFTMELTDEVSIRADHAPFESGELRERAGVEFTTGPIFISESMGDPCVEDCDGSGVVDFSDLTCVLFSFENQDEAGDADQSGTVDFNDLVTVLFAFGPCEN